MRTPLKSGPFLLCLAAALLAGCSNPAYVYHYIPGRTATVANGLAYAPPAAPPAVQAAVAAGNQIAGSPYVKGGGHGHTSVGGYDCSGAASYVLREAGLLSDSMPSAAFRRYGSSGEGRWITIYAKRGHVFLSVAGVRFDTGWTDGTTGPQWTIRDRPAPGFTLRHPDHL